MLFFVLAVGCNQFVSTDDIADNIKAQMQEEFDTNSDFSEYHLKVVGLTVVKQAANQYKGLSEIRYKGKIYKVSVDILMDKDNYMWEIPAENFEFIQKAALKEYQQEVAKALDEIEAYPTPQPEYRPQAQEVSYQYVQTAADEAEIAAQKAVEAAQQAAAEAEAYADEY